VKKNKSARQKAKSCRPPKDGIVVDSSSSYSNTLTFSMSGVVSKEKWEKIFGSKDNKKRTNKKT
jgi:hypothetical protein